MTTADITSAMGTGRRGPVAPPAGALAPLGVDAVTLDARGEWGARQERNAAATLPHCTVQLEESGVLDNFRRLVGEADVPFRGMVFQDSDLYKHLEALAWEFARTAAPETDAEIGRWAGLLARAQEPSGYLNTAYQGTGNEHFSQMAQHHEHYCAGHLFQAAVADHRASGSRRLMDVAVRLADHLVEVFGQGRRHDYDGHPEVETALIELFRETGTAAYLDLARQFLDDRGSRTFTQGERPLAHEGRVGAYYIDQLPVREAPTIEGHSVRAMYLEAGVVDLAVQDGDPDLLAASVRRWEQMVHQKLYITGGTGSRHSTEGFGDPYELPSDRAYAETCATIAAIHWSWRLQLATGRARYADLVELALHNAFAAGTGLDGTSFFYSNPLQVRAGHVADTEMQAGRRLPWYTCACCPPNIARMVASVQTYAAATGPDGIHLSQYMAGTYHVDAVVLEVATQYPWHPVVTITVAETTDDPWALHLRVPAWCTSFTLDVAGHRFPAPAVRDGEVSIERQWSAGDEVVLTLDMPARYVEASPRVDALRGSVAVQRGPIVYCVEAADQPGLDLEGVAVDVMVAPELIDVAGLERPGLRLTGRHLLDAEDSLYREATVGPPALGDRVELIAIPYQLWGNRDLGAMQVFVPRIR